MVHQPPYGVVVYLTTVGLPSNLVILKSDKLTPPKPWSSLDSCLTMTVHVSQLVRGCFYRLRRIKTIRKFIPTSAAVILINSFIVSKVDYCNNVLAGLQACQLDRIQSVLNSASRLIFSDTIRLYNRSAA